MASETPSLFRNLKIVLCGNALVGKRSLIKLWTKGSTFGSFSELNGMKIGSRIISLSVRAIKPEEFFNSTSALGKSFFSDVDAIVFVYDVTDQKSLSVMSFWLEQIAKRVGDASKFPVSFIVGNKIDDETGDNPVKPKTVRKFFMNEPRLRASHKVSAKTGENVDSTLRHLIMCCLVTEADPTKLPYLIPDFMLQALGKISSKIRLKYENKSFSPFDSSLDGLEQYALASPQSFIRSRIADELPSLLNSSRFLTFLKLAVQTKTLPVAKVALKYFQKLLSLGYLENSVEEAEQWIDVIAMHHQLMDSKYQDLLIQTLFTWVISLRSYRQETFLKAFGICFHICVIADHQQFDGFLLKMLKGKLLQEDKRLDTLRSTKRIRPLNIFSTPKTPGDNKEGLELVLAYLEEMAPSPILSHKKSVSDPTISKCHQSQNNTASLLFETICGLSTGFNRFVKVKGLPLYKHKSKLLFLKLITSVLQDVDGSESLFTLNRETFYIALTDSGISCHLDLFERFLNFTSIIIEKNSINSKPAFKEEIAMLLEIIIVFFESQIVPIEHKVLIRKFLVELTSNSKALVDIFANYDCNLHYRNLFDKLATLLVQFLNQTPTPPAVIALLSSNASREEEMTVKKDSLQNMVSVMKFLSKPIKKKHQHKKNRSGDNTAGSEDFAQLNTRKALLQNGIELFNNSPVKGIQFFQENGFVGTQPVQIARFLRSDYRLDRMAIGDYLGEQDPECQAVMKAFIDSFDFTDDEFVISLRKLFLHGFRLPGESQKIDRVMEMFAARYIECNPKQGIIASASAAHTLAFSAIMLNTDLHSPSIKQRMTSDAFVKNNRGINDSRDFPIEFLQNVYDDISRNKLLLALSFTEIVRQSVASVGSGRSSGGNRSSQQIVHLTFETQTELFKLAADEMLRIAYHRGEQIVADEASVSFAGSRCSMQAMFQTAWEIFQPVFKYGLESGSVADDEMAGVCIDGIYYALLLAGDFNLREIYNTCVEMLSDFTDRVASTALSESILNLIATCGGRDFISNFLRNSV